MANDSLRGRQTVLPLTNKSGGAVANGDLVIIDSTTASSFTTTATEGLKTESIGIALETIADDATGRVVVAGYAPVTNLDGAASLGDSIGPDGVAKQATPHAALIAGDFGQVLGTGTTPPAWLWGGVPVQAATGVGFYSGYMMASDTKAQNTNGGTFTLGAWRTRDITTEDADTGGNMAIAANQITLDAGTYRCIISCPAWKVGGHQAKLYNISDTADELIGTSAWSWQSDNTVTRSVIVGRFTIAAQKTFEVQHQSQDTQADSGFGTLDNFASEIYTIAEFWKEA